MRLKVQRTAALLLPVVMLTPPPPGLLERLPQGLPRTEEAATALLDLSEPVHLSLLILFLSGLSLTVGESIVLFANQVSWPRFVLSVVLSATLLMLSVVLWAGSIWVIAGLLFQAERPFGDLLIIVSFSYAPLMLGFLVLLPYLGNIILHLLNIWTFLATLAAVAFVYQFGFWQALTCTALGWVSLELLTRLPVVNISRLDSLLWRLSTGKPRALSVEDIVEQYVRQARSETAARLAARTGEGDS